MTFEDKKALVAEFQEAFEVAPDRELWERLVREELAEVRDALDHLLKEVADFQYVASGYANVTSDAELDTLVEELDITELDRAVESVMAFLDVGEAFRRVHASNMSKLGDDGKPLRREDGKVLKGPNYQPPVLTDLIP